MYPRNVRPVAVINIVILAMMVFAACSPAGVDRQALVDWADGYCQIHRDLNTALTNLTQEEADPGTLEPDERLARARRVGAGSISLHAEAALRLLLLPGDGDLRAAAVARARFFEARAVAWEEALRLLTQAAEQPDFAMANDTLESRTAEAEMQWRETLRDLDAEVEFAAVARARCAQ